MRRYSMIAAMSVTAIVGGRFLYQPPHGGSSEKAPVDSPLPAQSASLPSGSLDLPEAADAVPTDVILSEQDSLAAEYRQKAGSPFLGIVEPRRRVPVRSAAAGVIRQLAANEGDSLEAGAVLFQIDDTEITAEYGRQQAQIASAGHRVDGAKAQLYLAQDELDRNRKAHARGAVSEAKVVASQYRLQSAAAQLEALKHQVTVEERRLEALERRRHRHQIAMPFSGVVTRIDQYADQYVEEGDVVASIESDEKQLKLFVRSENLTNLDCVRFFLPVEGQEVTLKVRALKSEFNPDGSRALLLELPSGSTLLTGQMVQIETENTGGTR